jgi:hypothetical protein
MGLTTIIFTKLMLCIIILIMIINFIIYIERSMNIFIIYIGIIGSRSHFDYINFKASLVIKIINFNEIKNSPSSYVCHLLCDFLSKFQFTTHLLHLCSKISFFDMKIYKLITWYPNMVHIMWNDMVQYTFNFHKNLRYIPFHKYIPTSHFIKGNEIILFLISCLGYILT